MEPEIKREWIFQCAIQGAMAWTVYGIVESWFLSILPWFIKPHYDYIPFHWGFTLLLFGLYPTFGLILGGLCGLGLYSLYGHKSILQRCEPAILSSSLAVISVLLAFDINLVIQFLRITPSLCISVILAVVLVLGVWSRVWFERLRFLSNPLTAILALLGLPWATVELLQNETQVAKALSGLAYLGALFLASFLVQKTVRAYRAGKSTEIMSTLPKRIFRLIIPVAFIFMGASFFLRQEPHWVIEKVRPLAQIPGRPNVILIILDTVRADHLSVYGYKRDTTPNLKKFSEEAILYNHAIAPGEMTLPTHASIFTGLYARRHGAHCDNHNPEGRPLAKKFCTLGEALSDKGYLTLGIVANYAYLSHEFGLNRGFRYYDHRAPVPFLASIRYVYQFYYLRYGIRDILTRFASASDFDQMHRRAEVINQEVFLLLDQLKEDNTPFFLFINYMDAHDPYIPPAPFDTLYPGKDKTFTADHYDKIHMEVIKHKRKMTEEEKNHLLSQYDGGIAYIDFHIGKLIARLKDLGLYENCLIIITSDHGEAFGERDLFHHGVSVYQDQVYVPLIIRYPNKGQSVVVNDTVILCDLMPTILDVLGYEIPGDIDGQSLLKPKQPRLREVISESYPKGYLAEWDPRFRFVERAIFSGPLKLISSTAGKRELYDLSKDPDEKENLYEVDKGASRELEARLNQWLREVNEESGSAQALDKGALDRLKSLGYIK